jgi:predicted Zn finger-like uncharacterized protein
MDVRCPRCSTEYEFDDARVPEGGVTVKCTQCNHVFRVKKKALVVTLPVRPEDSGGAQPLGDLPPSAPSREWRVRTASGSQYTCKELTVLQRWIVEGKVGRDDEISLSGGVWKRLGDIPELASFFQVVEEAQKARAFEALRSVSQVNLPAVQLPPPPPMPSEPPAPPRQRETLKEPQFAPAPPPPPVEEPKRITETWREPQFTLPPQAPTEAPAPAQKSPDTKRFGVPAQTGGVRSAARDLSDEELKRALGSSGKGRWLGLAFFGLAIGVGLGWYFGLYLPEQVRLDNERIAIEQKAAEEVRVRLEAEARARVLAEQAKLDAGMEDAGVADAGMADAGAPDAGPPDAGVAVVDAGAAVVAVPEKQVSHSYDWYVAQGDRLRDAEKSQAALNMYGKALELQPDRVEPHAGRGLALLDLGQTVAAQAAFEVALSKSSKYGPALMGLAEAFRLQGKNEKAVEYYQQYLDALPNGSEADVARNNIERLKK